MDRRDFKGASEAFTRLLEKDLWYLSAYFALGRALLLQGEREKAQVYLQRFEELKKTSPMASTVGQAYGEQGVYSLAEDAAPPPPAAPPAISVAFREVSKAWGVGTGDWGPAEGIGLVDLDGAGAPELVVPTVSGVRLFRNADERFHEQPRLLTGTPCHGLAAGDVDKDGDADLLVSTDRGAALLRNDGGLRFTDASARPRTWRRRLRPAVSSWPTPTTTATWTCWSRARPGRAWCATTATAPSRTSPPRRSSPARGPP